MKTNKMIKWAACGASLMMMATVSARAADYYWDEGSGDWGGAFWSTNPSGGGATAVVTGSTDRVYFAATGKTVGTVTVSGVQRINNVNLDTAGYFLKSGTLDFTGGANGIVQIKTSGTIDAALNNFQSLRFMTAGQTLTLTGGWLDSTGNTYNNYVSAETGVGATSTLILKSGTYNSTGSGIRTTFSIGSMQNGTGGVVMQTGAHFINSADKLTIVNNGGLFKMEGGLMEFMRANSGFNGLLVGYGNGAGGNGQFIMTGGTISQTSAATSGIYLSVDGAADSVFDLKGGEVNVRSFALVSNNDNKPNATATLNISGGVANVKGVAFGSNLVGSSWLNGTSNSGTGTLNLSGGRLNLGTDGFVVRDSGVGTGFKAIINLSGGTIGASADWIAAENVNMSLSDAKGGVTFDTNGYNMGFRGVLSGDGGFTKTGNGVLLLAGANTFTGDAVINVGMLKLDDKNALGSEVDLKLTSGAQVYLNFGSGSDVMTVNSLWLDGTIVSGLEFGRGYSSAELNSLLGGGSALFNTSGIGLLAVSIPEPSAWALMVSGAALLAFLRRRR